MCVCKVTPGPEDKSLHWKGNETHMNTAGIYRAAEATLYTQERHHLVSHQASNHIITSYQGKDGTAQVEELQAGLGAGSMS